MARIPLATYRLQFHPGFTFHDAASVAGYLSTLGPTHLYASPYFQASPGSAHGYDVVDPGRVNEELGGGQGHRELCAVLRKHSLGQVLDVVPNHMAITGPENAWWWDVLENGTSSAFASFFDVDWSPPEERLADRVLLPILGDHYGVVLEAGEIRLVHETGRFSVHYLDHKLPAAPASLVDILDRAAVLSGSDRPAFIADALRHLSLQSAREHESIRRRSRNRAVIVDLIIRTVEESHEVRAAVDKAVEETNSSPDLLDAFLNGQNFRLAFWRSGERDLGYRRFFDINTLIGIRVEDETVFEDTHRLVMEWLRQGVLDGVRIDHPDGLRDPEQYFKRLRKAAPEAWVVVEKILHPGEPLPSGWPVAGTTGYDFLNLAGGLFIDPSAEDSLTDFYKEFTGEETDYGSIVRQKKHQVLHELLAADVSRLTDLMVRICERHRRYRDYSRWEINEALREMAACFPVYRSYMSAPGQEPREEDRRSVEEAVTSAVSNRPELDPELFGFFRSVLFLEHSGELELEWALRFQQLTGPAAAKGIEDTAFYCFNRFIGLNEVGGDPSVFGVPVDGFHRAMGEAADLHPHSMLATSTHDTKRGEDVRARLALLSEAPGPWADAVRRWSAHNEQYKREGLPDRNSEYFLYQTLAGTWPIEKDRVLAYMEKAVREAKVHTSWIHQNENYERLLQDFTNAVIDDQWFRSDMEGFVAPLVWPGRINSLAQALLKLTAPGVPDLYQGTELWDMSLVDPDNRRPVDFELRQRLLAEARELSLEQIMERADEGLPKLWMIHKVLELRKRCAETCLSGDYRPLWASGRKSKHVVAFLRGERLLTVVPRLILSLNGEWEDTMLELPEGLWRNQLTGEAFSGPEIPVRDVLARLHVALLFKD